MMDADTPDMPKFDETLRLATDIVAAYVANNQVAASEVPNMIRNVHAALGGLLQPTSSIPQTPQKPAVPVKKSVTDEYIICLEDGKKLKMLKRYLRSNFDMSPEEYRMKWGLAPDYPMVAPNYARQRSDFAKKIGLGRISKKPARQPRRAKA